MFAFPFVVVAQTGLVFFDLGFEFGEGFLASGADVFGGRSGVQRAGGQRQIQRKSVILSVLALRENAVELDEIGRVGFQQFVQFFNGARRVRFDFGIGVLVADRKIHACTCGMDLREGGSRRFWRIAGKLARFAPSLGYAVLMAKHSAAVRRRQLYFGSRLSCWLLSGVRAGDEGGVRAQRWIAKTPARRRRYR